VQWRISDGPVRETAYLNAEPGFIKGVNRFDLFGKISASFRLLSTCVKRGSALRSVGEKYRMLLTWLEQVCEFQYSK
jgi:hypothetical protein